MDIRLLYTLEIRILSNTVSTDLIKLKSIACIPLRAYSCAAFSSIRISRFRLLTYRILRRKRGHIWRCMTFQLGQAGFVSDQRTYSFQRRETLPLCLLDAVGMGFEGLVPVCVVLLLDHGKLICKMTGSNQYAKC